MTFSADIAASAATPGAPPLAIPPPPWHILWTRSHCEQLVCDQLVASGFAPFLPRMEVWSQRAGQQHRIRVPMFPGYLFLNQALDKRAYLSVRKATGLVSILGHGWDRLAVATDREMESIVRVAGAGAPVLAHPYLKEGRRVRIARGPLRDVEGILLQSRPQKGLVVLSVELLLRSVAVEVDCMDVVPA